MIYQAELQLLIYTIVSWKSENVTSNSFCNFNLWKRKILIYNLIVTIVQITDSKLRFSKLSYKISETNFAFSELEVEKMWKFKPRAFPQNHCFAKKIYSITPPPIT